MEWVRRHRVELPITRLAARQTAPRQAQLEIGAERAQLDLAVSSNSTKFFSLRRKRRESIGMPSYDQLEQNGEEPEFSTHAMDEESREELERFSQSTKLGNGEQTPRSLFVTPRPSQQLLPTDMLSTPEPPQKLSPKVVDAGSQHWLGRVSSTIRRKPTVIEAYKNGGIRSAWAYTFPWNWKSRNAITSKAITDSTAALNATQHLTWNDMDLDDQRRSALPSHWRDISVPHAHLAKRLSGTAGRSSDIGDWNSPSEFGDWTDGENEEMETNQGDQEFKDWIYQHKVLVEQYDPLPEASKRVSVISVRSKRRYSDYFRDS